MNKPELSIIILNYNTSELLNNCLESLNLLHDELDFEVIVVDNGSSDGSVYMVRKYHKWVKLVESGENLGFAKGNNLAKSHVRSDYVLFLNSDTLVPGNTLCESLKYLKENKLGAIGCRQILADGRLDKDARRSFITPWIGLVHLFLKLDVFFPKSRLFSKYWYGYISEDQTHDVDALQGSFIMSPKNILDSVGWYDEDYFLDGEDIDLCWKIKNLGKRVVYYPKVSIIHLKGATKGKNRKSKKYVPFSEKLKFRLTGVNSMEIFYRKRLWNRYPLYVNILVILGIKILKFIRGVQILIFK